MPIICKTRPVVSWDNINAAAPYSIEKFNAAKDQYHIASYDNVPFPYPYIHDAPSEKFTKMLESLVTQPHIVDFLRSPSMEIFSLNGRTMTRPGMPETRQNILLVVVGFSKDKAAWQTTADFLQDLFENESCKVGTYVPFVVELSNPYHYYHEDLWSFLPAGHESTQAVKAVKTIVKEEVAKCIPEATRNGVIYRMIERKAQPPLASDPKAGIARVGEKQPTVIVLVKPNSHLQWSIIESQIKAAMNKVQFGRTIDIYLEFGTGDKPPNSSGETPADKERQDEILSRLADGTLPKMMKPLDL